jgi:hypothetical protein
MTVGALVAGPPTLFLSAFRRRFSDTERAYPPLSVRPATAIVILILLAIIAVAGVIQLWVLFSPPS